jgi:hypothetical protein
MHFNAKTFWQNDDGAITVDWTVLAASVLGLSLATAGMMSDTLNMVFSQADHELRSQQMSDDFVQFTPAHFETLFAQGSVDPETAQSLFEIANAMMNQEIIDALAWGLEQMTAGTLSDMERAMLFAIASVAYQRNLVEDHILALYFGF